MKIIALTTVVFLLHVAGSYSLANSYYPAKFQNREKSCDPYIQDWIKLMGGEIDNSSWSDEPPSPPLHPVAAISSNGRYVVFERYTKLATNGTSPDYGTGIFIFDHETRTITWVSQSADGTLPNGSSYSPSVSMDGRYVAFESDATNLTPGDTNRSRDVFVLDRATGLMERVSVDTKDGNANGWSRSAAISADGHFVAYQSLANNLVEGDMDLVPDVFLRDRQAGITTQLSVHDASMTENRKASGSPSISGDGRYVAFQTLESGLSPDLGAEFYEQPRIILYDRKAGTTKGVPSAKFPLEGANGCSPAISQDGRYIAYASPNSGIVKGDNNWVMDIFLYDSLKNNTLLVSRNSRGKIGNRGSFMPSLSVDGRFLAFESLAKNLVRHDRNRETDAFVRDIQSRSTQRASINQDGTEGSYCFSLTSVWMCWKNSWLTSNQVISGDGRFVVFVSPADFKSPGASSSLGEISIYVKDLMRGEITRVHSR